MQTLGLLGSFLGGWTTILQTVGVQGGAQNTSLYELRSILLVCQEDMNLIQGLQ